MDRVPISSQRVFKPSAKKRRPPLACIQCYQRKLKCGRELPSCSRCSKAGNDGCTYRGNPAKFPSVNGVLNDGHSGSTSVVTTSSPTPVSSTATSGKPRASSDCNGKMTHLKGQGTITKFYGYSYPLNLYQQFAELQSYIVQIKTKNPAINTLRDEIYPLANDDYQPRPLVHDTVLGDNLRQLIPLKPVADTFVQTYIDRFEIIHRVLNISVFIADYNRHWTSPLCTPASFLVQFLLVAAAAASFHPKICVNNMSQQTVHDHALDWIEAAESWLNSSTNQPPQSWDTLATHCLLLIAKRANYIQEGSFWTYTGALVRWAMAAGYHREYPSTERTSLYDREMRRRLWMTIVELDIQAAVERGMPPSIRAEDFNIISPLNIDDDKLQESGQDFLESMPLATFTEASFQVHMYRSLPIRLKVCAFVNGCTEQNDFDRVLHLGEGLEKALQDIPEWSNFRDNPRQQQTMLYVKRLLNIYLHQYALLLHIQFAIQATPSFKSTICRRARLDASLKALDHYQKLIQDGNVPEQACKPGLVLAALSICHEIYTTFGPQGSIQSATMTILPQISTFLVTTVEQVLPILEKRLDLTFHGLNEYYLLSMVIGLVKSKLWPESCATSDKEAADRVIRICTILQTRRAAIQSDHSLLGSIDNGISRGLHLPEDASCMLHDGATELLGSMFSEDLGFFNDSTDFSFFHV